MYSTNLVGSLVCFFNSSVTFWLAVCNGVLVILRASSPAPANPTENKAPAVAPIVVSTVVLLGSNVLSSDSCHTDENTNGVANVANAPTFKSSIVCLPILAYLKFLPALVLIALTTPLPNLPQPNGIKSSQGSAISILTNSAPNNFGFFLIMLPTSFRSTCISPSSNR